MKIPIEFIGGHNSAAWMPGDKGEIVGFIHHNSFVQAIIVLEKNEEFVTSILQNFKRV